MCVPPFGIADQRADRGRMQGHEPGLAELGLANRQNPFVEIDIRATQMESLGLSKTGHCDQAEETMIGPLTIMPISA